MKNYKGKIGLVILFICILANLSIVKAETSEEIVFRDKNLQSALLKCYNWNGKVTIENASVLSKEESIINIYDSKISDLEGIQYFNNLTDINLCLNNLTNLNSLSELKKLKSIDISYNSIKGKKFEKILSDMGKINNLNTITADEDGLVSIDFLDNIGSIKKYKHLQLQNNKIADISILKDASNLNEIYLQNNRITDVTPLKDLKNLTYYIDLRDNCIIDYSPIKHLFDEMYEDFDYESGMDRYDFYTNPINFNYNGIRIKFPYLTVYYKYQAYAEALPLFKAFGGSAKYDKKTGTLTCKYNGNELVFKDFSKKYTYNGEQKCLKYPMRRMQYDLAYVPVKDICEVLGMNYDVIQTREFYLGNFESLYAPKLVEIRKIEKELG